ncbi:hypothetical protein HAX54_038037 [Datura stramonium]|uniref:GPN-loop GTPase 2 n=1 Tax=Datura stramonium TaxID=4076 RepID=A0ABS8SHR8_DATST|nr:hypothetical protein [Datura stramonium]
MVFGQVVIGPPGSGKTTYCNGMSQFLKLIGRYECSVNIEDLIKLSDVMAEHSPLVPMEYELGQDPRSAKYEKLTKELCEVIEDYGLVLHDFRYPVAAVQEKYMKDDDEDTDITTSSDTK